MRIALLSIALTTLLAACTAHGGVKDGEYLFTGMQERGEWTD